MAKIKIFTLVSHIRLGFALNCEAREVVQFARTSQNPKNVSSQFLSN